MELAPIWLLQAQLIFLNNTLALEDVPLMLGLNIVRDLVHDLLLEHRAKVCPIEFQVFIRDWG